VSMVEVEEVPQVLLVEVPQVVLVGEVPPV
jgi:hypothetical protein